ncbi:hypothetical protein R4K54_09950 [Brachyspira murdochii]|uniref:DUF1980 domain-containing protein n=1 Tax=Brachyspira murdochii TaxID=84378 RepID=A0ABX5B2Z0_9SPIR|nr:hypothetical protein [Brachyspira murdochii]PPS21640.1 hypothetical protein DJ52_09555 [Brachyspira murdochii]
MNFKYILFLFIMMLILSCSKKEYNDGWFDIEKNYVDIPQKKYDYGNPRDKTESNEEQTSSLKVNMNAIDMNNIIEIKERMFINQCNDVYLNPDDYRGKLIKLEGIYDGFTDEETGEKLNFVFRYGPGCCGYDGVAGFEFNYNGTIPNPQDWIEVVGVVEILEIDNYETVRLNAVSLNVLDKRGKEFVAN